MAKYHITKAGKPAKCNATEKACPLGGEHYDSPKSAAQALMLVDTEGTREQLHGQETISLNEAENMARTLMDEHGLGRDWSFGFNKRKKAAGICIYTNWKLVGRGAVETGRIELSESWTSVHSRAEVTNTILHEIAHAKAGSKAGHGPQWQEMASQLGARPQACFTGSDEEKEKVYPWKSECPECGRTNYKAQAARRVSACGGCSNGKFQVRNILTWHKNGQEVDPYDMPPNYRTEYASVRTNYAEEFAALDLERQVEPLQGEGYITSTDGGCHYYGAWNDKSNDVDSQREANTPDDPATPKKSQAQKDAEFREFLEVLRKMYIKKFGNDPEQDGIETPVLIKMFNDGELA